MDNSSSEMPSSNNPIEHIAQGRLFEYGEGVEQSYEKAIYYYQQAANQNDAMGQYLLASCYEQGKGVPISYEQAFFYYKKAADQGYVLAIAALGNLLLKNKIDEEEGEKYLKLAIQKGSNYGLDWIAFQQFLLAEYYEDDTEIKKSDEDSLHYYRQSANNGNHFAQERLGDAYREGSLGLTKSPEEAIRYYELAAHQLDDNAMVKLGECYERGVGCKISPKKAFEYYLKASEIDMVNSYLLGRCYENGMGIEKSIGKAIYYYKIAGQHGFPVGYYYAGLCYKQLEGEDALKNAISCFKLAPKELAQGELDILLGKKKNKEEVHKSAENDSLMVEELKELVSSAEMIDALNGLKNAAEEGDLQSQLHIAFCYEMGGYGIEKSEKEAFRFYKLAADQGSLEACRELYFYYLEGRGVDKSIKESNRYLKLLADEGDPIFQCHLAQNYKFGLNEFEKSNQLAIKYFKLAADNGFQFAQVILASCYLFGDEDGVDRSPELAFNYYTLALEPNAQDNDHLDYLTRKFGEVFKSHFLSQCEEYQKVGLSKALYGLYCCYLEGIGVTKSSEKAIQCLKLSADYGYVDAQLLLGGRYANGEDVEKSEEKAFDYFKLAADQGDQDAQLQLGHFYHEGIVVEKSHEEAYKWLKLSAIQGNNLAKEKINVFFNDFQDKEKIENYKKAADQGDPISQFNLGLCYEHGSRGLSQSYEKAHEYYLLAADQGYSRAQNNLGTLYSKGPGGIPQSDVKAVVYYQLAADQGHAIAQHNLGICYEKGKGGLIKSDEKAIEYYTLAAKQGYILAQEALKSISSKNRHRARKVEREIMPKKNKDLIEKLDGLFLNNSFKTKQPRINQ